jgi:3-hydroxy-3-methylglutaryl CoA synthase
MFSLRVVGDLAALTPEHSFYEEALNNRRRITPPEYVALLRHREQLYLDHTLYQVPSAPDLAQLRPGSFYLHCIDENHRRFYRQHREK